MCSNGVKKVMLPNKRIDAQMVMLFKGIMHPFEKI